MPPKEDKKATNAAASLLSYTPAPSYAHEVPPPPPPPVVTDTQSDVADLEAAELKASLSRLSWSASDGVPELKTITHAILTDAPPAHDALAHAYQSPVSSLASDEALLRAVKASIAADQAASDAAQQEYERLRAQGGQAGAQAPTRPSRYRTGAPAQSGRVDAPTLPSSSTATSQGGETVAPPTQLPGLGGGPI